MKNKKAIVLCECGIMIALATVLSMIKLFSLPFGGSITAFSAVPLIVISYRRGIKCGLVSGFAYSIIQLILDASVFSYATSVTAGLAIILLDYIFAFTFIGLAGIFKFFKDSPAINATTGTVLVCAVRYICHVISGCTVWAGVSIPSSDGLIYSLSYNATYMIPETIVNAVVIYWLFSSLNFKSERIERAQKQKKSLAATVLSSVGVLSLAVAVIIDAITLFSKLQNEAGTLDFSLIGNVDPIFISVVFAIGIVLCGVLLTASKAVNKSKD